MKALAKSDNIIASFVDADILTSYFAWVVRFFAYYFFYYFRFTTSPVKDA